MANASIVSVNISETKGVRKTPIPEGELMPDCGLVGDAHAEGGIRELSLLALESIDVMRAKGLDVNPGDFAENITTQGMTLHTLPLGTRLMLGEVPAKVSKIGKECHSGCAIRKLAGDCIMPREGIFVQILSRGKVHPGDEVRLVPPDSEGA